MDKTSEFHNAKSNLECALSDFIKSAQEDDRDLIEELDEALFNSCKDVGHKTLCIEKV